jgi:8-oxo-dGTP diphosphatase
MTIPQFGSKHSERPCVDRPSVWAIITTDAGKIAVVRHEGMLFLPGGGIDDGETAEEALRRECIEETGWTIDIGPVVARANEWVDVPSEGTQYNKLGTFYRAQFTEQLGPPTEPDHTLQWVTLDEFAERAKHEGHVWACRLVVTESSGGNA